MADNIHTAKVMSGVHKKDALERDAVAAVAESIERETEQGRRLYAMYLLCITCGLRTIEISRANVEDIKTVGARTYLYVQGKGHQEKDQPELLVDEVKQAISEYLGSRSDHYTSKSPLFVSTSNRSHGKRIAPTTISTMLKEALVAAGYDSDRITAHSLRHTSNTGAYKATHSLLLAQKHARHVDPATTEIYVHAEEREERNTEQQVYNYFFKAEDGTNLRQETINMVSTLAQDKLKAVNEFIRAIGGGYNG